MMLCFSTGCCRVCVCVLLACADVITLARRFVRGALANAASLQLPLMREALVRGYTLEAWLEVDAVAHACITAEVSWGAQ